MNEARQLTLAVGLRDDSSFDSYLAAANAEAVVAVQSLLTGSQPFVYLHGEPGSGRTHLLEAAVDSLARQQLPVAYLSPGSGDGSRDPELLRGLGDAMALVCLDDIDRIAGDAAWEEAVFHLFNEIRARSGRLLVTASSPPALGHWRLPDLASRLASGLTVGLRPLGDDDRLAILTFRAARRGYELPPETAEYLLARVSRRLDDLVRMLGRLEQESLVRQRRLTVPFVRDWLRTAGPG